ncbi:MAG: hypothetical protein GY812_05330 [Actinomycetia bacterium]|nr:hypothetical protein [Actinomycetes bacterium]
MEAPSRFDQALAASLRRATVVGAVAAVVLGALLAVFVHIVVGVLVMVVAGAAWVLWVQSAFASAASRVVSDLGRPVGQQDLPGFHNALEGVALLTGVAEPAVRLIESPAANAMVVADRDSSTVVVTSGLLETDSAVQVEVLAAELLCRVRDGSARYATLVAGLPAPLKAAAGLGSASLAATLGEQRALDGDFDAVAVTRYPPGLIAALEEMTERGTAVHGAQPQTAPLWIAPAVGIDDGVDPAVDRTANQPIEHRIAVLREL